MELGIQSISEEVLAAARRGHSAAQSLRAVRLLRSEGFSFVGQMMTGLPGADGESEKNTARVICSEGADGARIYPCIVFKNTPLEEMTRRGEYVPLSVEEAAERSAAVYKIFLANSVPVLKIGLHEGENLHSEDTYFAGPNHPAMGELVKSKIFMDNITEKLCGRDARGKCVYINVPPGAVSMASGHKKANKARIMEKTGAKCVKILENNELSGYNISIDIK